ncbi:MAG TPA: hypothetical protein VGG28_09735 [Kofleriaceae bacterium]|jgi:hypothetical protein
MWLAFAAISRIASADLASDVEKTRGLRFKHPVEIVTQDIAAGSATLDAWGVAHGGESVDAYYDGSAVIARPDAPELAIAAALDRALIEQRFPHAGSGDAEHAYEALETADAEILAIDLSLVRAGKPPIWQDADAFGELVGAADDPAFTRIAAARRTSWRAVDRVWSHLPSSTAELLHPRAHVTPIEFTAEPSPACALIDSTEFGELGARELLEAHGASRMSAREATAGWRGDLSITCGYGLGTAAIWRSEWASDGDAAAMRDALEAVVGDLVIGFVVERSDEVTRWVGTDGTTAIVERRGTGVIAAFGLPTDLDPWALTTRTGSARGR